VVLQSTLLCGYPIVKPHCVVPHLHSHADSPRMLLFYHPSAAWQAAANIERKMEG